MNQPFQPAFLSLCASLFKSHLRSIISTASFQPKSLISLNPKQDLFCLWVFYFGFSFSQRISDSTDFNTYGKEWYTVLYMIYFIIITFNLTVQFINWFIWHSIICVNQSLNESVNEWMNEWMNEWINKWIHKSMNEWNDLMNGRTKLMKKKKNRTIRILIIKYKVLEDTLQLHRYTLQQSTEVWCSEV